MEEFKKIIQIKDKKKLKASIDSYDILIDFNEKMGIVDEKLIRERKILKELYNELKHKRGNPIHESTSYSNT